MRDARIWGLIAVMVAIMVFPAVALAQPAPPQVFAGSVTQDGAPVAEGTEVTAWIDGVQVGAGTVTGNQYNVQVVQPEGQSFDGKTVTFQVAGHDVPETAIWQAGGTTELNLSAPVLEQPSVNTKPMPQPAPTAEAQPEVISEPAQPEIPATDAEESNKRRAFVGVVDGEPGATVDVIRNGTGELVTIRLEDYKLKTPGKAVAGSFADGARVVILSQRDGDAWVAIRVMVKPQKLVNRPVVGTVVGGENGVLSIIQPDGTTSTVELPEGAQMPETGEVITLFASDTDADEAGRQKKGPPKVKGLVKASKIRDRLEGFLQELTTDEAGVSEKVPGAKVTAAGEKAEAARDKALAARTKADEARAKAETAQLGNAEDLNEQAAEAEEAAAEAEVELAEADAEVAEAEAEAALEAAEAEKDAAERLAEQVSDVASILEALTSRHTHILQSLADGGKLPEAAMQGIATALENSQRGRSQATLKAAEARAKSEDKREKALAKAEEKKSKALAKAQEKRGEAQAKAAEKKEKDLAKAEKKREKAQAEQERETGKARAEQEREAAKAKAEREREAAKAKA